jgi:hypothetical protein
MPSPFPFAALLLVNLAPLLGVALAGWNLKTLVVLYCVENGVVGLYSIAKVYFATERGALGKSRGYQVIFFVTHFATFCVMYGAMVVYFLFDSGYSGSWIVFIVCVFLFLASHGVSFKFSFWDQREYDRAGSMMQMVLPYARVLPMHVFLVVAVVGSRVLGASMALLLTAAAGKIAIDAATHVALHRWIARQPIAAPEPAPATSTP